MTRWPRPTDPPGVAPPVERRRSMTANRSLLATVLIVVATGGSLSCSEPPPPDDGIRIGLMLSYSGYLAANSINSERALIMAIDAANAGGGVDGVPIRIIPKDTRSNSSKVAIAARDLLAPRPALLNGPHTTDPVTHLLPPRMDRT